jgi:hypothetical protein
METKISILNLSDTECMYYEARYQALPEATRTAASEVVKKLGLDGLWRGYEAAVVLVAEFKVPSKSIIPTHSICDICNKTVAIAELVCVGGDEASGAGVDACKECAKSFKGVA